MVYAVKSEGESRGAETSGRLWLVVTAFAVAALLVAFDVMDGVTYLGDIDDTLRALQVKQLVSDGGWYDRTLPMIAMPEVYVSPWSRLVDLPYALITLALEPVVGPDSGLSLSFQIWPAIMLAIYCYLIVRVVERLLPEGSDLRPSALITTVFMMILPICEFSPGRIDHHNMQLLLFMLLFLGLLMWTRRGAVLAGIACVLSVAVGLEMLPLVMLVLATVPLSWVLDRPGSRVFTLAFTLTVALGAPLAGLLLIGPDGMRATECDAFSGPYIAALAGYGAMTVCTVGIMRKGSALARFVVLATVGLGLVASLVISFPLCLQGPYHMIDPLSRMLWLDRVWQEKSLLSFFELGYFTHLAGIAALIVVALLALPMVIGGWRSGRSGDILVFAVAALATALTVVQVRYIRFPTAFVPLFVPAALLFAERQPAAARRTTALGAAALAIGGFAMHLAVPVQKAPYDTADYMSAETCRRPDTSGLRSLSAGRIMAPAPLGVFMAETLPPGMTVAAIPFHRASPGMRRMFQAFALTDPEARRAALGPFDYVAVCRYPVPQDIPNDTLYATLARGGEWPGLVRIVDSPKDGFQLFRIDHQALR